MKYKVNNKTYSLKIFWEYITLQDAVNLSKIKIDEEDFNKLMIKDFDELTDNDNKYIIQVIDILSDIEKSTLNKIDTPYLFVLWQQVRQKVNDLFNLNFESYKSIGIEGLNFKGKYYKLPKYIMIEDQPIVCYDESAKNMVEAFNISKLISNMKIEGISLMKYLCAIYLKEEDGEIYNEEKISKKAKIFEELPMSVVLEVFFFTYFYGSLSVIGSLIFSAKKRSKKEKIKKVLHIILGCISLLIQGLQVIFKKLKKLQYGNYVNYLIILMIKMKRNVKNFKK